MINFPEINPVILSIGGIKITWYALSYITGILIGEFYAKKIIKHSNLNITIKNINDSIIWVIIGIILGGRIGYVLFYNLNKYISNPFDILKTYQGGMSFHGGLIGVIIAIIIFSYTKKIRFILIMDLFSIVAPIGLFLGRIANFINTELYGRVTGVAWAVIFPNSDLLPRHPSQLYEAFFEGIILLAVLSYCGLKLKWLEKKQGYLSGLFLILYSVFRIIIEFFREADIQIGFIADNFTLGQILSLPMIMLGIYFFKYGNRL